MKRQRVRSWCCFLFSITPIMPKYSLLCVCMLLLLLLLYIHHHIIIFFASIPCCIVFSLKFMLVCEHRYFFVYAICYLSFYQCWSIFFSCFTFFFILYVFMFNQAPYKMYESAMVVMYNEMIMMTMMLSRYSIVVNNNNCFRIILNSFYISSLTTTKLLYNWKMKTEARM